MRYLLLVVVLYLTGCKSLFPPIPSVGDNITQSIAQDASNPCSPMLGWLGGICCLGGIVLLVISRGTMGWRPLIGGVAFILVNYALALYAHWFFIPVAIATGVISLAWAIKIVLKILKDEKKKEIKLK
jgi:hypothetical protein